MEKFDIYKAVILKDLSIDQVFYTRIESQNKLYKGETSQTGKTSKYRAENGFKSVMNANTKVWILE